MSEYQPFPEYPTMKRQLPARQLANFPAIGPLGWITAAWLWWLRRHLNRDRYRLTLKGRKPRRGTPRRFRPDVSMKWAARVGVYIDDKQAATLSKYQRSVGAHPERCKVERLTAEATHRSELLEEHHNTLMTVRKRLEDTRDELAAVHLTAARDQVAANRSRAAIDRIHGLLNVQGEEWNSETIELVAEVITGLGYEISDPNEPMDAVEIDKAIKDGTLSPADLPADLLPARLKGGQL